MSNWYDIQISKAKSKGYMNNELRDFIKFLEIQKDLSN